MASDKFDVPAELQKKLDAFTQADAAFKAAWDNFETTYATLLGQLENYREERNARLDDFKKSLRDVATELDITKTRYVKIGPFSVQKRWHSFYVPEKLAAKLEAKNLLDAALAEKILAKKIEVEKFELVQQFLQRHGVQTEFEDCEDGQEMTPAIMGPKPIAPLGTELKESR